MQLHRQLANMRAEHTTTVAAAAAVQCRTADAQPTEQPAQQAATVVSGTSRSAHIGCAALFAAKLQSPQPASSTRVQDELSCLSDDCIEADGSRPSSLPAANVVHSASQQLVAAAAAQAASRAVGCTECDGAAGMDASLPMLSQGPMDIQQPARQSMDANLVTAHDHSAVSGAASPSAIIVGQAVDMQAAKVCLTKPLVQDTQAVYSTQPPAAGSPDSRHAGNEQRNKSLPAAAQSGVAPASNDSERGLQQLTGAEQSIAAVRNRSGASVSKGSAGHQVVVEREYVSNRSVADMFASLSYLQDGSASAPDAMILQSVSTRDADGQPVFKKRRAEVS